MLILLGIAGIGAGPSERPRLREFGLKVGVLSPGPLNAITDVAGVRVGHTTLVRGGDIRTGVTAVIPHEGNVFQSKVPAGIAVGNGYGKLMGSTQVDELGCLETPIILTNTLSVPAAAEALVEYTLTFAGNEAVNSVNPVVAETNDGWLNDIRGRPVRGQDVLEAIRGARSGPVEEGSVGAGTGTTCFNFKGGIGTSSRVLPASQGGYTVGVLVQTNFGGVLRIEGLSLAGLQRGPEPDQPRPEGSCIIIAATDAPLDGRNLRRLAKRALLGIARTGGTCSNGSGDYAIAFSTAPGVRLAHRVSSPMQDVSLLRNERMSPLFQAAAEASEEAILNSLFKASRMEGYQGHTAEALPLDKLERLRNPDRQP